MDKTINRMVLMGIILGMIALTAMLLTQISLGSAPSGLPATVATSSTITVGPHKPNTASSTVSVFVKSGCSSRVISTRETAIELRFSNTMFSSTTVNPAANAGIHQLASTTVVYDSGQYGCGFVSVFGYATTSISIAEFQ